MRVLSRGCGRAHRCFPPSLLPYPLLLFRGLPFCPSFPGRVLVCPHSPVLSPLLKDFRGWRESRFIFFWGRWLKGEKGGWGRVVYGSINFEHGLEKTNGRCSISFSGRPKLRLDVLSVVETVFTVFLFHSLIHSRTSYIGKQRPKKEKK